MAGRASGLGSGTTRIVFCALLGATAGACGPTVTKSPLQTETEGGKDDNRAFGTTPPLGNPPAIDATAPAADFLIEVSTQIQPAWRSFLEDCRIRLAPSHPLNNPKLQASFEVTIDGQGAVLGVKVLESSGNDEFDAVAAEILNDLQTLPPPPPEWISDDNQVVVGWKFARDIRQASSKGGSIHRLVLPIGEALQGLLGAGEIATAGQRILDAGGRSIPVEQVDMVLHRSLELALSEEAPATKVMALEVVGAAKLTDFRDQARALLLSTDKDVALAAAVAIGTIGNKIDIATLEEFTSGERPASASFCAAAATSLEILGRGPQVAMTAASNLQSPNRDARMAALAVLSKLELESGEAVAVLAKILSGANKSSRDERALAAAALGRQASRYAPAIKALLAGTSNKDAALRTSCVEAIASSAKAGTRSRLAYWKVLELVRTKDERVRAAAVAALAALDPLRFSKELQSVRAGGSQLVVMSMASVLGDLPGPIALGRLLDLAAVPNVAMRSAAAFGLAKRQDDKAKSALRGLLADTAPSVRVAALRSLTSEDELKPLLQDESTEVRVAALAALATQLGKAHTARSAATMIAGTGPNRDLQVRLAKAWLVAGQ